LTIPGTKWQGRPQAALHRLQQPYLASPAGFSAAAFGAPPPLLAPAMPGRLVVKVLSTKAWIVGLSTFGALNTA
jgi:hypothetical protein